ncbi:MAG: GNAT family N-acetyltransferase [bacterium]
MPKVKLRLQKVSDAKRFYEILNNNKFVFFNARPKSAAAEKEYLKNSIKYRKDKIDWGYTIIYGEKIAGGIGIKINYHRKYVGEIGYFIDENFWSKGIATRAVKLAETICFKKLKLSRIEIVMRPENIASEKVAIKNGYLKEGRMRKAVRTMDGKMKDCYLYAKVL